MMLAKFSGRSRTAEVAACGHGEMTDGIDQRRRRQAEGEKQHEKWMSRSGRDDAADP